MADKRKKKSKALWIVLGVLAVVGVAVAIIASQIKSAMEKVDYSEYTVAAGSIAETVTGSGVISMYESCDVTLPAGLYAEKIEVSPGDEVAAGDVLFYVDGARASALMTSMTEELNMYSAQLTRMAEGSRTVTSPASGRVMECYAAPGDELAAVTGEWGAAALLSTDGKLRLSFDTAAEIERDDRVKVRFSEKEYNGTVVSVTAGRATLTVSDDNDGFRKSAEVYLDGELIGGGTLEINAPQYVYASSGVVESVDVEAGDRVSAGEKLYTLTERQRTAEYFQLFARIEKEREAVAALSDIVRTGAVTAEYAGRVESLLVTEGGAVLPSGEGELTGLALTLKKRGETKLNIAVDELDILAVAAGQRATVSVDAALSLELSGEVGEVGAIGNTAGGLTTYGVTIALPETAELRDGMNATATVVISEKPDALLLPLEIVEEDDGGSFVYLKNGEERIKTYIETGLSDGINAEVTSGLSAGDVVSYVENEYQTAMMQFMAMRDSMMSGMQGESDDQPS